MLQLTACITWERMQQWSQPHSFSFMLEDVRLVDVLWSPVHPLKMYALIRRELSQSYASSDNQNRGTTLDLLVSDSFCRLDVLGKKLHRLQTTPLGCCCCYWLMRFDTVPDSFCTTIEKMGLGSFPRIMESTVNFKDMQSKVSSV